MSTRAADILLIGGGGHARSVWACAPERMAGYIDHTPKEMPPSVTYKGTDAEAVASLTDLRAIICLGPAFDGSLNSRAGLIDVYEKAGFRFATVIAPTAFVAAEAAIGDGTAVMHRVVVNTGAAVGRHCVLNTGCIIEHDCHLGQNVFVGPAAVLCGGVEVGENTFIGAGAVVLPGISVGPGAVIGAGAVVIDDIPDRATAVGNPAKII